LKRNRPQMNTGWIRISALGLVLLAGLALAGFSARKVVQDWKFKHFRQTRDAKGKLNVLVITMDTTRYDHIGCFGSLYTRTPNIDRIGNGGVRFMQTTAAAPITLPNHSAIFTGTYPIFHGVRNNGTFKLAPYNITLAEVLKDNGYDTGAVIGAFVLSSQFGLDQGFDDYNDKLENPNPKLEFFFDEIPASEVSRLGNEYIDRHLEKPFFLWLHFFDPHAAYRPPSPYKELYGPANLYDGEIAFVDENVGKVVKHLEEKKLLDHTLIVLTADHGESLGDHGEPSHGLLMYDTTLHVPLLFYLQDRLPTGEAVKEMVRSIDIMPTILDLLEIPQTKNNQGVSLLPRMFGFRQQTQHLKALIENYLPYFNFGYASLEGLRTGEYKYINAPEPELYDLKADVREYRNLFQQKPRIAAKFEADYQTLRHASAGPNADKFDQVDMDEETKDRLRALGYVWASSGSKSGPKKERKDPKLMIDFMTALNRVGEMIRKERWDQAEEFLKALLQQDPGNQMALQKLALVYNKTNNTDGAIEVNKKLMENNPDFLQPHLQLARLFIRKALATPEKDKVGRKAQFDQAIGEIQVVLAKDKRHVQAKSDLGACYFTMGDYAKAEEVLRQVLTENPRYPYLHYNLGATLAEQKHYAEAETEFQKALSLQKNDPDFYFSLAKLYQKMGDPKRVQEYRDGGLLAAKKAAEAEKEAVEGPVDDQPPGVGPAKANKANKANKAKAHRRPVH
jgi:arylsulfatase A-like enzyme/Tfp pilus assembly protein PilF